MTNSGRILIFLMCVNSIFLKTAIKKHKKLHSIDKKLLKHFKGKSYSLVVFYRQNSQKMKFFTYLSKELTAKKKHFLFIRVKDKHLEHVYAHHKVSYFPNFRFYMGHHRLYTEMMDKMYDEEEKFETNFFKILGFLHERLSKSSKRLKPENKKFEAYKKMLTQGNPSFVFYLGYFNDDSKCNKLFKNLARSTDEFSFIHMEKKTFSEHFMGKVAGMDQQLKNGLYFRMNHSNKQTMICREADQIHQNKKVVVQLVNNLKKQKFRSLRYLDETEIEKSLKGKNKILIVLNYDFFIQEQIKNRFYYILQTLFFDIKKKLQSHDFFQHNGKIQIYRVYKKQNVQSFDTFNQIVGTANNSHPLYMFKFDKKKNRMRKYIYKINDPTKESFSLAEFQNRIKTKKAKEFFKVQVSLFDQQEVNFNILQNVSILDIKKINELNESEAVYYYCFWPSVKGWQKQVLGLQQEQGMTFYGIDLEQNQVGLMYGLDLVDVGQEFILVKPEVQRVLSKKYIKDIKDVQFKSGDL